MFKLKAYTISFWIVSEIHDKEKCKIVYQLFLKVDIIVTIYNCLNEDLCNHCLLLTILHDEYYDVISSKLLTINLFRDLWWPEANIFAIQSAWLTLSDYQIKCEPDVTGAYALWHQSHLKLFDTIWFSRAIHLVLNIYHWKSSHSLLFRFVWVGSWVSYSVHLGKS